jgi:hypothetical protein
MMSNQELRSLDERTAKVAEKIAGLMQAKRRGEAVELRDVLALIDGLRDELPNKAREEWKGDASKRWNEVEAPPQPVKPAVKKLGLLPISGPSAKPKPQQQNPETNKNPPKTEAGSNLFEKLKSKSGGINFHKSDLNLDNTPITVEEKDRELERLADLMDTDPIAYAVAHKELAKRVCVTITAIDKAVKIVRDKRDDKAEQSQATKLLAIGMAENVRRWHAPSGEAYASVKRGTYWQNFRIDSRLFRMWLLDQYAQRYTVKIGNQIVPLVPGNGAIRDAVAQLEGIASFRGPEQRPAYRVGGTSEEIWIDLGDDDWRSIKVTVEGWQVQGISDIAFVRSDNMLPLPEPVKGGNINLLRKFLCIRPEEFVLAVGWMLQALNPVGPYPEINVCGPSEAGKTTTSKLILGTVDPNTTQLRRPSRKVEDLLIAARNGWTVGLDNMSWLTVEMSDTLCMVSTGISSGTRAHYTNDEEHVYTVMRPVLFNGIPSELIERGDLASRTIKLQIPRMKAADRIGDRELAAGYAEIWPQVFGALLDGLVAALRGRDAIHIAEPARLADFEKFAEAGCRGMGFKEREFVRAYEANRRNSLVASLEGSAVGRAVLEFMNSKTGKDKGFAGQMSTLLTTLSRYGNETRKDWPRDATRLGTALDRILQPLEAVGVDCLLRVDRRKEGGSQCDVTLRWRK